MASETSNLFDQIASIRSVTSRALHRIAYYDKEYTSVIDLIIDVLRSFGVTEQTIVSYILSLVTGSGLSKKLEEKKANTPENVYNVIKDWDEENVSGWLIGLEDAIKVTIANILTSILSCSVNPYIPSYVLDNGEASRIYGNGILIPTSLLDFSGVLDIAPTGTYGKYFYNVDNPTKYYQKVFSDSASASTEVTGYNKEYYYRELIPSNNDYPGSDDEEIKMLKETGKAETIDEFDTGVLDEADENSPEYYYNEITDVFYKKMVDVTAIINEVNYSGYIYTIIDTPTEDIVEQSVLRDYLPVYLDKNIGMIAPDYIRIERSLVPGTLYQTKDFNAFLWNCINRGSTDTQTEKNKMMWDSRRKDIRKNGIDTRFTENNGWSKWLNAKQDEEGSFESVMTESLFPILQLEEYSGYTEDNCVLVSLSSDKYNPEGKRKTIYEFNKDYLESINIFCPKVIILNTLMELSKVRLYPEVAVKLNRQKRMIDARIASVIEKILEVDDLNISDCYYSFSNNDYNQMLREADYRQYGAKEYDGPGAQAIIYTEDELLRASNEISENAALNKDTNTITTTIYQFANMPVEQGQILTSFGFDISIQSNFLSDIIYAIVMPLVRAVFSPQIILLFMINFEVMGLIDLSNLDNTSFDKLMTAIFRKLLGAIITIVKQIKDAIATILFKLLNKYIKPLIDDLMITLVLEELDAWLSLLRQALNLFRGDEMTMIDSVAYADITKVLTTPESEKGEC